MHNAPEQAHSHVVLYCSDCNIPSTFNNVVPRTLRRPYSNNY